MERRFTSRTALDQTPWGGSATFTESSPTQGFLFIHRVNLWFVFVVCSAPILNNKLVRHPDGATSHLFKVMIPSRIRRRKLFCRIETAGIIYAPVFIIHQYALADDWWEVINAVVTSHQNQLDHHKNVPQVSKLLGKGKRLERICSLQRLKLIFFAWDVYHHCNMIALDCETD